MSGKIESKMTYKKEELNGISDICGRIEKSYTGE